MLNDLAPDISTYSDAWMKLGNAEYRKELLDSQLDKLIGKIYDTVMNNPKYYVKGRPPAVSYIGKTFEINGYSESTEQELIQLREALALLEKEITELRGIIKSEEMKLSVYQTMSANSRNVVSLSKDID